MSNSQFAHLMAAFDVERKMRELDRNKEFLSTQYASKDTVRTTARITKVRVSD